MIKKSVNQILWSKDLKDLQTSAYDWKTFNIYPMIKIYVNLIMIKDL